MAATGKLTVRNVFADETKMTVTINNINPAIGVSSNLVAVVKNFNANNGGELAEKMKSKNGFNWVGIDRVTYTVTDRTYIF